MQAGCYSGASYTFLEGDVFDENCDRDVMVLNGGYRFNEYFSAEGRIGFGVSDDDLEGLLDIEVDSILGVYGKFGIPTGTSFYPYAILGYSRVEIELSSSLIGGSESDSDNDLSYGIGADFSISDNFSLNAEYMVWYDDDDIELSGLSIGAIYKF